MTIANRGRSIAMLAVLPAVLAALACEPALAHGTKTKTLEIVHPWCADRFEDGTRDVIVGMTIRNIGRRDDVLVSARMTSGERVEIVAAPTATSGSGVIVVARGASVDLHKAAVHLRILGLKRALAGYDTFPLTLVFKNAGAINVDVMVEEIAR